VVEVERTVNASGNVSLGDHMISAGLPLTGQRVTLRLDGPVAHIPSGGVLARTIACPIPQEARPRLRGARAGTAHPPRLPGPLRVTRRVSVRGAIIIGGQNIQVGLAHARKTVKVTVEADTHQITIDAGIPITAPRTTDRDIRRPKASNYPGQQARLVRRSRRMSRTWWTQMSWTPAERGSRLARRSQAGSPAYRDPG
jgi:hypothetical protein